MLSYALILLLVVLLSMIFGAKMYYLAPNKLINRAALVSFFLTALYALVEYSLMLVDQQEKANLLGWFHQILILPLLLSFFITSRIYSSQNKSFPKWYYKWVIPPYYLIFLVLLFFQFSQDYKLAFDPVYFDGHWHYVFNSETFIFWLFEAWIALTVGSAIFNFYHGFKTASLVLEKRRRLILLGLFIVLPAWIVYAFLLEIDYSQVGNYIVSPFLFICILGLSLAYSDYQLLQISPLKAFKNIMNSITNQVLVMDNELKVVYLNQAAAKLWQQRGDSEEEQILEQKFDVHNIFNLEKEEWSDLKKKLQNLKLSDKLEKEISIHLKEEYKNLLINFSPVFGKKGKIGYAMIASDVTKLKQYEEKLEAYAQELKDKNQELERFAYIASHDLKTPVRNIVSFLGLINRKLQNVDDEDLKHYIAYASQSARNMFSLVEDVLEFSRLNKNQELKFQVVDTNELVCEAVQNLEIYIKEKDAIITCRNLPKQMTADPSKMIQLFQNLIENGIKYNQSPQPNILISCQQKEQTQEFSIEDNGIGIESTYKDSIFDMFKRLHNRQDYEGTGIGLAVCKKIVQLHQGKIWVDSEVGKGSVFRFVLQDEKS